MRNGEQRQAASFPKSKTAMVAVHKTPSPSSEPPSSPRVQPQSALPLLEILVRTRLGKAAGLLTLGTESPTSPITQDETANRLQYADQHYSDITD